VTPAIVTRISWFAGMVCPDASGHVKDWPVVPGVPVLPRPWPVVRSNTDRLELGNVVPVTAASPMLPAFAPLSAVGLKNVTS